MLSIEEIKLLIEKLEKLKKEDFQQLIDKNLTLLKELATTVEANNYEMINRLDKTVSWFRMDNDSKREKPAKKQALLNMAFIPLVAYRANKRINICYACKV